METLAHAISFLQNTLKWLRLYSACRLKHADKKKSSFRAYFVLCVGYMELEEYSANLFCLNLIQKPSLDIRRTLKYCFV